MKSKTLYHGSRHLVKILEPKQASGFKTEDNQFAIYAIENKKIASLFSITYIGYTKDARFEIQQELEDFYVHLYHTSVDWNQIGYLYILSSEYFNKIDEYQWVAYKPIIPQRIEIIQPRMLEKYIKDIDF
ncbi:hypothetical protein [Acinetobacter equi]|uniref:Uncharacterized protein n=1 Tax=Acinetobacter equi TaxID=1324350 RepID=A0A0N7GXH4_9GAMM|nr:hypothetical protein [Acinetobacter equi]ALH94723.1 hypothetical protein AOY20_03780 [Acinetobacter equi]